MVFWVSFPKSYQLQDVQAGLNVAIAILSASGIFVFVRYSWQVAARNVAKKRNVPVYSLLSLNTVGEAWDVVWLLKRDLFTSHYLGLLAQCLIVLALTATTILSGFIARYSTRYGYIVKTSNVNGTIALRTVTGLILADVEWNSTLSNIVRSNFPQDQLLEYLPDQTSDWMYSPSQWNNSWSMDCSYTNQTSLTLADTGNCTDIFSEISGLSAALNPNDWGDYAWDSSYWQINQTMLKDVLTFIHGVSWGNLDNKIAGYTNMTIKTVAVHMSYVPTNDTLATNCTYRPGEIGPSSYTAMTCALARSTTGQDEDTYGAYPDFGDRDSIASSYTDHYATRFRQESARNHAITVISGKELVQLYQAYSAVRDTAISPYTTRPMDVSLQVAQISLACLIICCIAAVLVLLGLGNYALFVKRHWESFIKTPESKLDWMLQTINANGSSRNSARQKLRQSMTSGLDDDSAPLQPIQASGQTILGPNARADFEGATWLPYRTPSVRTTTSYTSLQPPATSPYMYSSQMYASPEDTTYDPTRRTSGIQPVEDGFFQSWR